MILASDLVLVPVRPACPRTLRPYMSRRVKSKDYHPLILSSWRRIMTIACTPSHATYDPSCVVCEDWYDIALFARDAQLLPGWGSEMLSRNYYGANCFSPETSRWITRSDNKVYSRNRHVVIDDVVFLCEGDAVLAIGSDLRRHVGRGVVKHGSSPLLGHKVEVYTPPEGMLLRRM